MPRPLKIILGIAAAVLIIGILANMADRKPTVTSRPTAPVPAITTYQPTSPPAPAGPLTTFSEGVWEVGVDIVPGKYKTTGESADSVVGCYYARKKNNDGELGDILDNSISHGPVTVTIKDSDGYFDTSGCADWVLQP